MGAGQGAEPGERAEVRARAVSSRRLLCASEDAPRSLTPGRWGEEFPRPARSYSFPSMWLHLVLNPSGIYVGCSRCSIKMC